MLNSTGKGVALLVLVVGLVSLVLGGFFIHQGFDKANLITEAMRAQEITYGGAGGAIVGIVDNRAEAQVMSDILLEHSKEYGSYTSLGRDDPNRQTILNALTMVNSLQMAVMGYGLTDVVKASGAFMILVGFAFVAIAVPALRQRRQV